MFQYRAGIISEEREPAVRFSFQEIEENHSLQQILVAVNSLQFLQLHGILQLRFQGWITMSKKGKMSYPSIYIYIFKQRISLIDFFLFASDYHPDSWRINWIFLKYYKWYFKFYKLLLLFQFNFFFRFFVFCAILKDEGRRRRREENIDWTFYERPFEHFYSRVKVKNIGCVNYRFIVLQRLHKIGKNHGLENFFHSWIKKFLDDD